MQRLLNAGIFQHFISKQVDLSRLRAAAKDRAEGASVAGRTTGKVNQNGKLSLQQLLVTALIFGVGMTISGISFLMESFLGMGMGKRSERVGFGRSREGSQGTEAWASFE